MPTNSLLTINRETLFTIGHLTCIFKEGNTKTVKCAKQEKSIITCRKLILKEEEGEIRTSYNLQTGRFFLGFSYSSLLCVLSPDFTFLISQLSICSSRTRTSGLGLGLHEGLGNFGHGGSVGHTGGLDRTDSICISVEGGASTGTTAWV